MPETFPVDAVPNNGWVMELPGMTNPHITKVQGVSRKTGTLGVVDGGSNRMFFFSDGILEHGPLTLSRTRDNTVEDKTFAGFFDAVRKSGSKVNGKLIQYRHGKTILKILFTGLLMNEDNWTDFDVEGTDKSEQSYVAQCDFYEIKFVSSP